jgi:hypothetical protein
MRYAESADHGQAVNIKRRPYLGLYPCVSTDESSSLLIRLRIQETRFACFGDFGKSDDTYACRGAEGCLPVTEKESECSRHSCADGHCNRILKICHLEKNVMSLKTSLASDRHST